MIRSTILPTQMAGGRTTPRQIIIANSFRPETLIKSPRSYIYLAPRIDLEITVVYLQPAYSNSEMAELTRFSTLEASRGGFTTIHVRDRRDNLGFGVEEGLHSSTPLTASQRRLQGFPAVPDAECTQEGEVETDFLKATRHTIS